VRLCNHNQEAKNNTWRASSNWEKALLRHGEISIHQSACIEYLPPSEIIAANVSPEGRGEIHLVNVVSISHQMDKCLLMSSALKKNGQHESVSKSLLTYLCRYESESDL